MTELKKNLSAGLLTIRFHADAEETAGMLRRIRESQSSDLPAGAPTKSYDRSAALLLAQEHLKSSGLSFAGTPEVLLESGPDAQGMTFVFAIPLYPEVRLGPYKGIAVPFQEDPEALEASILTAAINAMHAEIPEKLLVEKQMSIESLEREFVARDSSYILLADVLAILESACRKLGVSRPPEHSFAEAVELMTQFMSQDPQAQTIGEFQNLLQKNLLRLCEIPPAFDKELDRVIFLRQKKVREQTEQERQEELFQVYLRSRGFSYHDWREEALERADYMVRLDLLLNAVAAAENLHASAGELDTASSEHPGVPRETLSWMLIQEKAKKLILNSAVIIDAPA